MFLSFPPSGKIRKGDMIALIQEEEFIGYGKVVYASDSEILVRIDPDVCTRVKTLEQNGIRIQTEFTTEFYLNPNAGEPGLHLIGI